MIYKTKNFTVEITSETLHFDGKRVHFDYNVVNRNRRATNFQIKKELRRMIIRALWEGIRRAGT